MKKCKFCMEEIQSEAIKCRFCGEMLDEVVISKPIVNKKTEVVLYTGKMNWSNYIFPILICFTLYLAPIGIYYIYYQKLKKIELTNKKFTFAYGILSKDQLDIKLEKIESIAIRKNIFDMIFGSGTLIISGTGGNNEPIYGVDKPEEIKEAVEKQIN